jgi:hypothetical protein
MKHKQSSAVVQFITDMNKEIAYLLVKANEIKRLLNRITPILNEIEAIEAGTASPLNGDVEAELNERLMRTALKFIDTSTTLDSNVHLGEYTVPVAKLRSEWAYIEEVLLPEKKAQLEAVSK